MRHYADLAGYADLAAKAAGDGLIDG